MKMFIFIDKSFPFKPGFRFLNNTFQKSDYLPSHPLNTPLHQIFIASTKD